MAGQELPTGTVTFLLTDVEGSTQLWDAHPREAGSILARHDELIEAVAAARDGAIVRPRGEGDSRFVVFARATDAVAAAIGIQRAFATEPWVIPMKVRIALHTGEAELRGGDYYGGAPNRCARLRALAAGGQTLLSRATHDLVADVVPDGASLRDLGARRLKDLSRAEHIFQLVHPDVPDIVVELDHPMQVDPEPPLRTGDRAVELPEVPLHATALPSIIGRTEEVSRLRARIEAATRGTGGVAVIEGEAGIGKSRLVLAALEIARDAHAQIAVGRAHQLERERPFGPLVDALALSRNSDDPLRAEIGTLLGSRTGTERGSSGVMETQFAIVERIVDLVESLAVRRPLVLVIEDLHWADVATLRTVHRLASRLADLPAAILCTTRPTPRSSELQSVLDGLDVHGATRIPLGPLEDDAVGELVRSTIGATPGPHLLAKAKGAAGNPLFISELLAALEHEHLIETTQGVADVPEASLPPTLALTVLRRLAFLADTTLEILRLASALGAEFSLRDLSTVMGRTATELLPELDDAKAAGLIGEADGRLQFRHELVRDAIYEDILLPIRTALHAQIGAQLRAAGAPLTQVATHVVLGAERGDPEAIDILEQAAKEVTAHAPDIAIELLEKAITLVDRDPERRNRLDLMLAAALVFADRAPEAAPIAQGVASRTTLAEIRTTALCTQAWAMHEQGKWRDAVAVLEPWINDPSLPERAQARLVAEIARSSAEFDRVRSEREALRAIELGRRTDDATSVFLGTLAIALCRHTEGRYEDALKLYDQAEVFAGQGSSDDLRSHGVPRVRRLTLTHADRFDEAARMLDDVREHAGGGWWRAAIEYHHDNAHLLTWSGRWDEAIAEAEPGVGVSLETGRNWELDRLRQILIYIAIHRDQLDAAAAQLAELPRALWTRALLAQAKGDGDALAAVLDDHRKRSLGSTAPWYYTGEFWWYAPDWVRLYVGAGDHQSARAMAEIIEEGARRARTPTAQGAALLSRGLAEGDVDVLMRAVEAYRVGPRIFDRALACEDAATAIAERSAQEAVALLEEAMVVYEQTGAVRDIARADATLRTLGVRRGRRGARRRPKVGWESLTETESRVTSLVEQGLSYREIGQRLFISKRTVETHVAHVFGKLGLSSRRELAEQARHHAS